ncbi:MAG: hypothetical protein ACM3ZU_02010 [Bacteroidota bacterium]
MARSRSLNDTNQTSSTPCPSGLDGKSLTEASATREARSCRDVPQRNLLKVGGSGLERSGVVLAAGRPLSGGLERSGVQDLRVFCEDEGGFRRAGVERSGA